MIHAQRAEHATITHPGEKELRPDGSWWVWKEPEGPAEDQARKAAGVTTELHFHDLRHTGNTPASTAGASTRELMTRMGHSSSHAALIYQHMTSDRDRAIADRLGAMIRGSGGVTLGSPERAPSRRSGTRVARHLKR